MSGVPGRTPGEAALRVRRRRPWNRVGGAGSVRHVRRSARSGLLLDELTRLGPAEALPSTVPAGLAPQVHRIPQKEGLVEILGWIFFGLIVGAIGKLLVPGRDPGGIIVTILLGIAGAVLGGFVGRALNLYGPGEAAGFVMSLVGAIVLLLLYRMVVGRRRV